VDLYIHFPIHLHGIVLNELSTGTTILYLTDRKQTSGHSLGYIVPKFCLDCTLYNKERTARLCSLSGMILIILNTSTGRL
jgi:hypothetical protein